MARCRTGIASPNGPLEGTGEQFGVTLGRQKGKSVADTVAEFVRCKHITQVIFGRAPIRDWRKYLYLSAVHRFLRESPEVDVHIVTQEPGT